MLIRLSVLNDKLHRKMVSLGIPEEVAAYVSNDDNRFPPATRKFVARALAEELAFRREHAGEEIPNSGGATVQPISFEELETAWHNDIIKIRDWLRFAKEEDGSDLNMHKYPEWDDMLEAAERWHDEMASEHYGKGHPALYRYDDPQHTDIAFPDGWRIVKVDAEDLDNEGDIMGHCVGGYSDAVESGKSIIYSLRDPMGEPHVTWELERDDVSDSEVERELERKARKAEEDEWEYWEKERWPERAKELEDDEFADEFGIGRKDLEMAIRKSRRGSRKRQQLEEKLEEYERELESWLDSKKDHEMEVESQFMFDDMDWDEWRREIREELEREAGYDCSQIQGKQDRPPLDRYRPYLREFFKNHKEYGTRYVNGRLASVAEAIQRQVEADDFSQKPLGDNARNEDLGPFYDALIEKAFADPQALDPWFDDRGTRRPSLISPELVKPAVNHAIKTKGHDFIRRALASGLFEDFIFPHDTSTREDLPPEVLYDTIPQRLLSTDRMEDFVKYLRFIGDEGYQNEWQPLLRGPILQKYEEFLEGWNGDGYQGGQLSQMRQIIGNMILGNSVHSDSTPEEVAEGLSTAMRLFRGDRDFNPWLHSYIYSLAKEDPDLLAEAAGLVDDDGTLEKLVQTMVPETARQNVIDRLPHRDTNRFPGFFMGETQYEIPYEEWWPTSFQMPNPFDEELKRRQQRPSAPPDRQLSLEMEAASRRGLVRLAGIADDEGLYSVSDRVQSLCS